MASGPLGPVWYARDPRSRGWAVKVLTRRHPGDVARVAARAAAGHPTRIGPWGGLFQGHLAVVSAWQEGLDLLECAEILRERDLAVPWRAVCDLSLQIAHRLGEQAGPHGDLKPSNVLADRGGTIHLLDAGLGLTAFAGDQAAAVALQHGVVRYLSPGRRGGNAPSASDDVYAAGIHALELLRGRGLRRTHATNPAHDRYLAEVVARLEPLPPSHKAEDQALRNLILRMVAWEDDGRPAVSEVASALQVLRERLTGPTWAEYYVATLAEHIVPLPDPEAAAVRTCRVFAHAVPAHEIRASNAPAPTHQASDWEETEDGWRVTAAVIAPSAPESPRPERVIDAVEVEWTDEVAPDVAPPTAPPRPWGPLLVAGLVGALVATVLLLSAAAIVGWWLA